MSAPVTATDADLTSVLATTAEQGKPVLLDFWATWCGPCRQVAPVLDAIAAERADITVVKVDIDEAPDAAQANGILGVPTLMVIAPDGGVSDTFTGPKPKQVLLAALDNTL